MYAPSTWSRGVHVERDVCEVRLRLEGVVRVDVAVVGASAC